MAFQPQERAKAIAEGKARYYTGRPCKHGHLAERQTSNGECLICTSIRQAKWRKDNPERVKAGDKKKYNKRREEALRYSREYRLRFPEKVSHSNAVWRSKNKHKKAHYERRRQARKLNATPPWLTEEHNAWMNEIYRQAKMASETYSTDVSVDHIIPLQGKDVCGLHVPWNLQLTSRSYNSSKGNTSNDVPFSPSYGNVIYHSSALPWNLKEISNGN